MENLGYDNDILDMLYRKKGARVGVIRRGSVLEMLKKG